MPKILLVSSRAGIQSQVQLQSASINHYLVPPSHQFKILTHDPHDPAVSRLGIYLKEIKTLTQKVICIPMFIATSFTIAKIWK